MEFYFFGDEFSAFRDEELMKSFIPKMTKLVDLPKGVTITFCHTGVDFTSKYSFGLKLFDVGY